ncbi:MAG: hypothetical protein M1273_08360 [Deltaproteobacteria bacterium]|jgi:hypothetical protein|nr:hypothetical protein [Deltaproteobacteria bacterium]
MAYSSDEIIKREIIDIVGYETNGIKLRIFPQSSNEDQKPFSEGGLTFGSNGVSYGSCDAAWFVHEKWIDGLNGKEINVKPIIALEGTDALSRNSAGNALYQRFHHALGAVKNGVIGIYYLKKGKQEIQPDLFGMAYFASMIEKGKYLIIDDLSIVKELLDRYKNPESFAAYINAYLKKMHERFLKKFNTSYNGDWTQFAKKRSTILKDGYVIKYAGRMRRNFTDGSQRAGHIAVGEMFLTKYYFYDKKIYYLFPRMTHDDLIVLDQSKTTDKEWFLLRNEPNVEIKTMDDIEGLNLKTKKKLIRIKDKPLKRKPLSIFRKCMEDIVSKLESEKYRIKF